MKKTISYILVIGILCLTSPVSTFAATFNAQTYVTTAQNAVQNYITRLGTSDPDIITTRLEGLLQNYQNKYQTSKSIVTRAKLRILIKEVKNNIALYEAEEVDPIQDLTTSTNTTTTQQASTNTTTTQQASTSTTSTQQTSQQTDSISDVARELSAQNGISIRALADGRIAFIPNVSTEPAQKIYKIYTVTPIQDAQGNITLPVMSQYFQALGSPIVTDANGYTTSLQVHTYKLHTSGNVNAAMAEKNTWRTGYAYSGSIQQLTNMGGWPILQHEAFAGAAKTQGIRLEYRSYLVFENETETFAISFSQVKTGNPTFNTLGITSIAKSNPVIYTHKDYAAYVQIGFPKTNYRLKVYVPKPNELFGQGFVCPNCTAIGAETINTAYGQVGVSGLLFFPNTTQSEYLQKLSSETGEDWTLKTDITGKSFINFKPLPETTYSQFKQVDGKYNVFYILSPIDGNNAGPTYILRVQQ